MTGGGWVRLEDYARVWLLERPGLRPRTRELYEGLLRLHVLPGLGGRELSGLRPADVRAWRAGLLASGVGESTVAKAYRLLRAVCATAVDDGELAANPCRLPGAGVERPAERPVLTPAEVNALADAMPERLRLLPLLATWASLRWGELAALTRSAVDPERGAVTVRAAVVELRDGRLLTGPPKTAAGRRVVALPATLLPDVRAHLATWVGPAADTLVFTGPLGAPLRRSTFQRTWRVAVQRAGLDGRGLHVHDLRHTGNTLAARSGATMPDLMARMGHASTRAASLYLHTDPERDRVVADALDRLLRGGD